MRATCRARCRAARGAGAPASHARPPSTRRPTSAPRSSWRSTTCWRRRRSAAETIALPAAGAPFGSLLVDTATCTMCLSCVGACPEGALLDNPERPQLRFIEKNCVQCGLCATTCPEDAITLQPRLWLADDGKARKAARVLHEVRAVPLRALRQAVRHAARDRDDDRQAGRPRRVPGRGRRAPEDVRRLPRHRHAHATRTKSGSPICERRTLRPRCASRRADDSEELARAELYGLLAQLWLAPPDAALLQQFKVAVTQAPEAGGHPRGAVAGAGGAMRSTTAARSGRRSTTRCSAASASPRSFCTARTT